MSMTDPIADMLTRLRNAASAKHDKIEIAASKIKVAMIELLKQKGFIDSYRLIRDKEFDVLKIVLKYNNKSPMILGVKRLSKPGRRVYCSYDKIPKIKNGAGMVIVSTSKGLLTDTQARKNKLGGELICSIW
ncbi:MAG: 30S ribosomal protein S8 [Dissulfuribacterales bacterium]